MKRWRLARHSRPSSGGFTYLGVLLAIALIGISLSVVSEVWSKAAERQKVAQLEWVMDQYVKAIESYYYANTGSVYYYPEKVEDLLEDKRHIGVVRHLRATYPNPFSNQVDWNYVAAPTGGVNGIEATLHQRKFQRIFRPLTPTKN